METLVHPVLLNAVAIACIAALAFSIAETILKIVRRGGGKEGPHD